MKLGTDTHGSQRIDPSDFPQPPTFHVASIAGQSFHSSREITQHLHNGLALNYF